jgi:hypothetical protein
MFHIFSVASFVTMATVVLLEAAHIPQNLASDLERLRQIAASNYRRESDLNDLNRAQFYPSDNFLSNADVPVKRSIDDTDADQQQQQQQRLEQLRQQQRLEQLRQQRQQQLMQRHRMNKMNQEISERDSVDRRRQTLEKRGPVQCLINIIACWKK